MRWFFIALGAIGLLAMFLGLMRMFGVPFGYCMFTNSLFECLKCKEACIWLVTIGGLLLAVVFFVLASKSQNRR